MEFYKDYLKVPPIGGFTTVYFPNQKFGEVDPTFVEEFFDQLPAKWKILDFHFDAHIVTFNKDKIHPLLLDGWHEMTDVFDLHQNEVVHLGYYGNDVFGILASKTFVTDDQLPNFHSRCITPGTFVRFQVQLSRDTVNNPYLSLWNEFESFVRESNFNVLTACCDNGTKTVFQVSIHDVPFKTTTIGLGWWAFCRQNGFRSGDVLCFKFSLQGPANNVVRVFKISH
ncbi:hypothetical protein A2U01_0004374 [Trifolium medium]|uniref:TF-B3 domain-containing protein n=1 Tax=Trifolium medium TaxID=97028 RepID=A0A392M9R6_9FABA|nr:hypothetical protein [Trifolium medium]